MPHDNTGTLQRSREIVKKIRLAAEEMNVDLCLIAAIESIKRSRSVVNKLGEYITKINKSDKIPAELTQLAVFHASTLALVDVSLKKHIEQEQETDDAA